MNDATNNADALADKLSDRQVSLLASVSLALTGGPVPSLSIEEWNEAEALFEQIEADEAA